MNKGDTILLELDYTLNGEPLKKDAYDEIEIQIKKQKDAGSMKLLLSRGDIIWDFDRNKYVAMLFQGETFDLTSKVDVQVRVCRGAYVASSDIQNIILGDVLSREVMYAD